jgi:DNA-binding response OmpR family regulator
MNIVPRPPPLILFIKNHTRVENQFDYLTLAGLRVAWTFNDRDMLATVLRLVPDLIVLDFNGLGDTAERLKADSRTMYIPLIALAELAAINNDTGLLPN